MEQPRSLARRLIIGSLCLLPIFFAFTGFALDRAFQRSLIAAEKNNLQGQIYLLLAAAEVDKNRAGDIAIWMPETLHEPRFSQTESGLYAAITPLEQPAAAWLSASTILEKNLHAQLKTLFQNYHVDNFSAGNHFNTDKNYFNLNSNVYWDSAQGAIPLRFSVYHSKDDFQKELIAYRDQLWLWLSIATAGLIAFQLLMLHWGLGPLRALVKNLTAMHSGDTHKLDGAYPREIQPLADNLNQVLEREAQQRQRYRDGLGNLAHSLKTPLAVLHGQLADINDLELRSQLQEQIARMDQVVRHQLQRAVMRHSDSTELTPIHSTCQRLCNALGKVYTDKNLQIKNNIEPSLNFRGDSADLMEVLGNLLENACKFSQQQIIIEGYQHQNELVLSIEDDGPGIPKALRNDVLRRGERADSVNVGQGIGLTVAAEIVRDYGGQLSITKSSLGGAGMRITLPTR